MGFPANFSSGSTGGQRLGALRAPGRIRGAGGAGRKRCGGGSGSETQLLQG